MIGVVAGVLLMIVVGFAWGIYADIRRVPLPLVMAVGVLAGSVLTFWMSRSLI